MDSYDQKYLDLAKTIVLNFVPNERFAVFLFGSRVDGTSRKYSDIDIGILGNEPLSFIIKSDLKEKIENSIIPYDVDIIDFSTVSEKFKNYALQNIVVWHQPKSMNLSWMNIKQP